jgi:hypothetical protein
MAQPACVHRLAVLVPLPAQKLCLLYGARGTSTPAHCLHTQAAAIHAEPCWAVLLLCGPALH